MDVVKLQVQTHSNSVLPSGSYDFPAVELQGRDRVIISYSVRDGSSPEIPNLQSISECQRLLTAKQWP